VGVEAAGVGEDPGVAAAEGDDVVFGDEIRDDLVVRGKELGFGGFPGDAHCPVHAAASLEGILSSAVVVFYGQLPANGQLQQATVADRHAMGLARQVFEHLFRSPKWPLGVGEPYSGACSGGLRLLALRGSSGRTIVNYLWQ
jgi:hypothetical protein